MVASCYAAYVTGANARAPAEMTEPASPSSAPQSIAVRVARLVARIAAEPAAVLEHRTEIRALTRALTTSFKGQTLILAALEDGVLLAGGEACTPEDPDAAAACVLLAARFAAFGVDELTLSEKSAEADLNDLARLLATTPPQPDPVGFFAARASAIDARGIPRKLRARATGSIPVVPPPTPVAAVTAPEHELSAAPEMTRDDARTDALTEAIEVPTPSDATLVALFAGLQAAKELSELTPLLKELAEYADLAFRTGRFEAMIDAIAGLVAIEYHQLEKDSSDARRQEFAAPLRQLASPRILRQLAVLRHTRAADLRASRALQAILSRFGTDGAEALIDEYANAASDAVRAELLTALRGLRRTPDALYDAIRETDDNAVRQAVLVLGALGDEASVRLLTDVLRHPEPRLRRAAVAALDPVRAAGVEEQLGIALGDESPLVRARAVVALMSRGPTALKFLLPTLEREPDKEVLYSVIHAVGSIGTAEGIQALILCAQGESAHPSKKESAFRLQACAALVLVRTPHAMAAVGVLRADRDRAVREGSLRLVAQAARRPTITTQRVVAD